MRLSVISAWEAAILYAAESRSLEEVAGECRDEGHGGAQCDAAYRRNRHVELSFEPYGFRGDVRCRVFVLRCRTVRRGCPSLQRAMLPRNFPVLENIIGDKRNCMTVRFPLGL